VRPNFIAEAIFSGHRLAREIDTDDPSKPLPFLRERLVFDPSARAAATLLGNPTFGEPETVSAR
jgi:hypothetical protein